MALDMEAAYEPGSHPLKGLTWLNAGVIYLDANCMLTVHNVLAAQILDVALSVGQSESLETCLGAAREETELLRHMAHETAEWRNQIVTWTGGGRIRHVLIDTYLHRAESGDVVGVYAVMKDLGNFTMIDQHMQRTERLATVAKVAAGVAHEVRNPLTTVRGFLQIIMQGCVQRDWPEGLQYGHWMLDEIDQMEGLVQELLLLSTPQQFAKSPCQLPQIVQELRSWLDGQVRTQMQLDVIVEDVPNVTAEPEMLKYVIRQLVENAVDAMGLDGHLTINVRNGLGYVQLDIHDTGPGIPYYQMDKVFDTFFTTKDKGTGLGLPICQRIVADHGGEIRVSSKGFGTTFSVLLPIA